jgi:anti-anti-sigma regulatory factor
MTPTSHRARVRARAVHPADPPSPPRGRPPAATVTTLRVRTADVGCGPSAGAGSDEPEALSLCVVDRVGHVELRVAGELDMATAPRLIEAVRWLRRSSDRIVVVDTRAVGFVGVAGDRALRVVLTADDGRRDPQVALVIGPAVARMRTMLTAAGAGGRRPRAHT